MSKVLDRSREQDISNTIVELFEDIGYEAEEFVPGAMLATRNIIEQHIREEQQALDEAVDILSEE